ncbi:MAG: RNA-binding S4 domain-containing protein [Bacteroidales bacterium]|nr:RNA-binding S4 domain-containing protein [Bacteroidales bacterium]
MIKYKTEGDYIELIKLLKLVKLAQTGGHAKLLVDEGAVKLNGQVEIRKRAKIRKGDRLECNGELIEVE